MDVQERKPQKAPLLRVGVYMDETKAEEYRATARRVRDQASQTTDRQMKETLFEIASRYEWMADWIDRGASKS